MNKFGRFCGVLEEDFKTEYLISQVLMRILQGLCEACILSGFVSSIHDTFDISQFYYSFET